MLSHTTISPWKPASDNMSRRRGVGMATHQGSRTSFLLPTRLLNVRRDGHVNVNYRQETCSPDLIEESWVLQQCHSLAPVPPQLCPRQITNHVPQRKQILWSQNDVLCPTSITQCVMEGCIPQNLPISWCFCHMLLSTMCVLFIIIMHQYYDYWHTGPFDTAPQILPSRWNYSVCRPPWPEASENPATTIPTSVTATTARPDVVVIKDNRITLLELTVPTNTPEGPQEEAAETKLPRPAQWPRSLISPRNNRSWHPRPF